MDLTEFEQMLQQAGFGEVTTRELEATPPNEDHAHEFTARGFVSAGEFIIARDGIPRSYRAGEQFEVVAGRIHNEAVGPEGATVTTGRKY